MFFTLLVLFVGVVASALSFVFIRESTEAPAMLAAYRVLLAGLVLLPWYLRDRRQLGDGTPGAVIRRSLLPGLILGIHFIAWVMGARMTTAANATLIVNLVPVVMPFLMLWFFKERLAGKEILATVLALIGMLVLTATDLVISPISALGDLLSFVSMLLFAAYLAVARAYAHLPSIWLYVVPVYLVAGFSTLIVACFFTSPFHTYSLYNLSMIASLALVSTVLGHTALNYAMQRLRGQTVSIINMSQFVVAGIAGYIIYREVPHPTFYFACFLLIGATLLVIINQREIRTDQTRSKES